MKVKKQAAAGTGAAIATKVTGSLANDQTLIFDMNAVGESGYATTYPMK